MDKWTEWYKIQLSKGLVEDWDSPVFELGYTFLKDCKKIEASMVKDHQLSYSISKQSLSTFVIKLGS